MYILLSIAIILALYALVVAREAHKQLEIHKKLAQLAESIMWNKLLENEIISQEDYEDALERFQRNVQAALTSDEKKLAQIKAIGALLERQAKEGKDDN